MDYLIRKAVPSDERIIRELFVEMLRSIYHTDEVKEYEDGYLDKFFCDGEDVIFVAESAGSVIGYISIESHREDRSFIYIDDFCVDSSYRGNGIGSKLIKISEEYSTEIGISSACLHVDKTNTSAIRFYGRLGYSVFEDQGNRYLMCKENL